MADDDTPQRSWYLIYSKPCQEQVACENLARQGYVTYLPLIRGRRRRRGRHVDVIEPMFPRYLFIHLNAQTDNWSPIRSTLGVTTLVRFGYEPAKVPDNLVAMLKGREDAQGIQNIAQPDFRRGEGVRITDGAMSGYEGIFLARTGKERVIVLLSIAGSYARVHLSADQIERLS